MIKISNKNILTTSQKILIEIIKNNVLPAEIAKRAKLNRSTINRLCSGKTESLKLTNFKRLLIIYIETKIDNSLNMG